MNQTLINIFVELLTYCKENSIQILNTEFYDNNFVLSFKKTPKQIVISSNDAVLCRENQINYSISEFERQKKIVFNKILIINQKALKIFARDTTIKKIEKSVALFFFNSNHILGYCNAYYKFGLFYKEQLIMAALFSKSRMMTDGPMPYRSFELVRICSLNNYIVIGGLSKLIKHFINQYHAKHIMTYVDTKTDDGKSFEKIGFKHIATIGSNKKYILDLYNFE